MRSTKSVSAEALKFDGEAGFPTLDQYPLAHGSDDNVLSEEDHLRAVFKLLYAQIGHDFSSYKRSTVSRRIARRITMCQVDDLAGYIQLLHQEPKEVEALFQELLIGVTHFFRDPEAFQVLEERVIPHIVASKRDGQVIRVWVPGCATGEEVYSLAMLFVEQIAAANRPLKLQIFATDIDEEALSLARSGLYPERIRSECTAERLNRYFRPEGNRYRINKQLRDVVVFASHNLIKDPPFSRLDLVSCRNVLIYLGSELQKRVIPLFHNVLNPEGFLFLGTAESILGFGHLFADIDQAKKKCIFKRQEQGLPTRFLPIIEIQRDMPMMSQNSGQKEIPTKQAVKVGDVAQKFILDRFTPAFVVVNAQEEVLYFHGRTSKYLEPPTGEPSHDIMRLARPELRTALRWALLKASNTGQEATRDNLVIPAHKASIRLKLTVHPLPKTEPTPDLYMVLFEEMGEIEIAAAAPIPAEDNEADQIISQLEQQLENTKDDLQTSIEDLEATNEELKSANEELLSLNEELQSTNEELETSKEELQSMNEEVMLINTELENKIEELALVNSDINNLLINTEIPTLILTSDLHIKRYTPSTQQLFHIIPSDIERPIHHIAHNLRYDTLLSDVEQVFRTLKYKEIEIQDTTGEWYILRILPYRTIHNVIDGVILTFTNTTFIRQTATVLEQQYRQLTLLFHMVATFSRTTNIHDIFESALDSLLGALNADRASILIADDEKVMRFRTWRGLSAEYRQKADGHSPWSADEQNPQPLLVADVQVDPAWETWQGMFQQEGVRALGFIPIQYQGQLVGKFMLYYDHPHIFTYEEIQLAQTIATHVAFALDRTRSQAALVNYGRQQSVVAELGQQAIESDDLAGFMNTFVRQITQTLDVPLGKVLELLPEGQSLLLRAGVGWQEGLVGQATVAADLNSQAGYTLAQQNPVIVTDLRQETRFQAPPLLVEHDVISGMSVIIAGDEEPYGVLGVHTTQYRLFTEDDVHFLQSMAHILSTVIHRHKTEAALRAAHDSLEATVEKRTAQLRETQRIAQIGGWEMDVKAGQITWTPEMYHIYGVDPTTFELNFETIMAFTHPDDRASSQERFRQFMGSKAPYESHIRIMRPHGEVRYLYNRYVMICDEAGKPIRLLGTSQDETESRLAEAQILRKAEQLAALNEMGQMVVSSLELKTVLAQIMEILQALLGAEGIFVLLRTGEQTLQFTAVIGEGFEHLTGLEVPADAGIAGEVMQSHQVVLVQGQEVVAQRAYHHIKQVSEHSVGALLAAPVKSQTQFIGVLEAIHSREDAFSADDVALLAAAAAWTSIAIGNARLYEKIHRNEERLRQLTDQLVATQEEERRRISRELHDEAGQALTVLKLNLAMIASDLKESPLSEQLIGAGQLVAETMQRLRLLAYDLRPPEIDVIGLNASLQDLCENFSQRTRLDVHYTGEPVSSPVSDAVHLSFYRCLQEALTNAAKHAQATRIEVRLQQEAQEIRLTVWDNGQGFDPSQQLTGGLGLLGMKERLERLGGSLNIDSEINQGTTLVACVDI